MSMVFVSDIFDDPTFRDVRFLEEAARLGPVHVWLWSDELASSLEGSLPRFPLVERLYFIQAIRYVRQATPIHRLPDRHQLPRNWPGSAKSNKGPAARDRPIWVVDEANNHPEKSLYCQANGLEYLVINENRLNTFPRERPANWEPTPGKKKVLVTGCFDYLHSGHVHFFEGLSQLGDLTVVVGHDDNIRQLKGAGHPLFPQEQRRYMVQAIRFVEQALVSSGSGWMDAAPEIERVKPDLYVVNEDGDKPEKRAYCLKHGLEYLVLKREPKAGLPARQSTELRGF